MPTAIRFEPRAGNRAPFADTLQISALAGRRRLLQLVDTASLRIEDQRPSFICVDATGADKDRAVLAAAGVRKP